MFEQVADDVIADVTVDARDEDALSCLILHRAGETGVSYEPSSATPPHAQLKTMPIRMHDTRRREKVNFTTLEPGKVSMYVCGVTVYDRCHFGHARCYLAFDLIHRWLESSGYDVQYVQNFTDIDDKIIHRANELDGDWKALVDKNIEAYYEDMDALNILRADEYPSVHRVR